MVVDLSSQMETQSKANQELFEKLMARIDSRMNSFKNELMEALGLNKFPPLVRNEELGNLAGVSEAVKIAGNSELLKTNREVEVSEGDAPCLVDNHMHEDSLQSLAKLEELSDINKEIDVEVTINNEELAVVVNCVVVDDLVMHKVVKKSYNCAEFVGMDYVGWVENLSGMNIDFASFVRIVLTSMRLVLQVEGELDVFYGNPRMQGCSGCPFDPGGIVVAERGMEDEWEYENGQETRVVVDSVLSGNAKRLVSHSVEQQIAECTVLDSVPYEIVEYKDCDVEEIKAVVESERVKNSGTSNVPDELISKQMEGGTPIAYFPIEFRALNPLGNYDYMKELLGALRIASALQAVFGYSELIWIFLTLINPLFVASILSRIQRVLAGLLGIGIEAVSLTENVHNIAATKMGSRREASLGAVVVIALPLVGKVGGFIAFIPKVKVAALLCFMWVVLTALDTPNLHYSLLFLLVLIMGKHQKGNAFMGTGNLTLHLLLKGYINLLSLILEKLIHMRIVIMSLTSSHNFDPWGQGSLRGAGTVTPQEIRSKEEAELTETGTRTTPFYSLGC